MIKESIHQEDITLINSYVPNIGVGKYVKKKYVNGEIDSNIIILGDFDTSLSTKDRSF